MYDQNERKFVLYVGKEQMIKFHKALQEEAKKIYKKKCR